MHLHVYSYCPASMDDFVDFWSRQYDYPAEDLYKDNIGRPLTPDRVRDLFVWKNGTPLSKPKARSIQDNFIKRIEETKAFHTDTPPGKFLEAFPKGGAIFRIFWLHCWQHERFPIYDQHVHRAMIHIDYGRLEEITNNEQGKIDLYVKTYLPFWRRFAGMDPRDVDKALWSFGRFIKTSRFPVGPSRKVV